MLTRILISLSLAVTICVFLGRPPLKPFTHNTWTLSQHRQNTGCGGVISCAVTGFTAISAGSLIVGVGFSNSTAQLAATGTSGGGTWTVPSGCAGTSDCSASDSSAGSTFSEYILSSTGSPTSITVFSTASNINIASVFVFTFTSSPASFDVGGSASRTTCTTCAGISLSPTGNDVIIQYVTCAQTCASSASAGFVGASPYTNPADFFIGDGMGGAINQASGTAPNWSQSPTGTVALGALAFKESGGGPACKNFILLMGAGCR